MRLKLGVVDVVFIEAVRLMELALPDLAILGAVFGAVAIGQASLTASLLSIREDPRGIYRPLLIFFVASAIAKLAAIAEWLEVLQDNLAVLYYIELFSILAYTLILPVLWIYVRALTAESDHRFAKTDLWHLSAFFVGVLVSVMLLLSPAEVQHQIIYDGDGAETRQVVLLSIGVLALIFTWITQAVFCVAKILNRLTRYHTRLKDFFASTEGRELHWIACVVALLGINVLTVICDIFVDVPPHISLVSDAFYIGMVWVLSVWGLRVTPALEVPGTATPSSQASSQAGSLRTQESRLPKYEKSPLTPEHLARISEKLDSVMKQQKPYLEPSLSLGDLAKAISTPPNYLSQTLNSRIGETFFDYVNAWRIKEAIPMIVGSAESIQNIVYDVGFNSRSSFYKAFKRETNMTPSAYRAKYAEAVPVTE